MIRHATICTAALVAALSSPATAGHEGDIYLGDHDGRLTTGKWVSSDIADWPRYVFGGELEDGASGPFSSDPGFDAPAGSFDPAYRIGFNILDALLLWTGEGFAPTGGETLTIDYFGQLFATTGDGFVEGFELWVQTDGGWHKHYGFTLNGDGPDDPEPGVYLLDLEMYITDPDIDGSEPFWIVFNYDMPQGDLDAAMQWAEDNLVSQPCPADVNEDDIVDIDDLFQVLGIWGSCPDCPEDLNDDGAVDIDDLFAVLGNWGPCP